jgi:Uma2 family endonuclease
MVEGAPLAIVPHGTLPISRRAEHTMGMPAATHRRWTAAEVRALPDEPGKRFEVVDGELFVTPAPAYRHQFVVGSLYAELRAYCRRHHVASVIFAPADVELDPSTLVQPDVFVLPLVEGRLPQSFEETDGLLLAVEVLSPSTSRQDRLAKRARYQRAGAEAWIVDIDARLVERWLPEDARPEIVTETLEWTAPSASEPLTLDLPELFAEALGERLNG